MRQPSSVGSGGSGAIRVRHLFGRRRRLRSDSEAPPFRRNETHNRSIVRSRKAAATRWFASESGIGRSRWAQAHHRSSPHACVQGPTLPGPPGGVGGAALSTRRSEVYGSHARRPASRLAGTWDTPRRPACRGMGDARRPGNGSPVTDGQCASAGGPATGRRRRLVARQRDGSGSAQLQQCPRLGNGSAGGACQAPGLGNGLRALAPTVWPAARQRSASADSASVIGMSCMRAGFRASSAFRRSRAWAFPGSSQSFCGRRGGAPSGAQLSAPGAVVAHRGPGHVHSGVSRGLNAPAGNPRKRPR